MTLEIRIDQMSQSYQLEDSRIVQGWSHNVILKYAPLSHKMRYSMFL